MRSALGAREPERQGRSDGHGANRQPARDARDRHAVHDVVSRPACAVHHQRVRLDGSQLSSTQRLQRRLHAALLRRIEFPEMQNSQAAHRVQLREGSVRRRAREHFSIDVDGGPGVRLPVEAPRPGDSLRLPQTPSLRDHRRAHRGARSQPPSIAARHPPDSRSSPDRRPHEARAGRWPRPACRRSWPRPRADRILRDQRSAATAPRVDKRPPARADRRRAAPSRGRPGQAGRQAAAGWS